MNRTYSIDEPIFDQIDRPSPKLDSDGQEDDGIDEDCLQGNMNS
jgi:hypothetical protein